MYSKAVPSKGKPVKQETPIEGQILLNISDKSFTLMHTDNYDIVDVFMILTAALDHIEDEVESKINNEAKYLQ